MMAVVGEEYTLSLDVSFLAQESRLVTSQTIDRKEVGRCK